MSLLKKMVSNKAVKAVALAAVIAGIGSGCAHKKTWDKYEYDRYPTASVEKKHIGTKTGCFLYGKRQLKNNNDKYFFGPTKKLKLDFYDSTNVNSWAQYKVEREAEQYVPADVKLLNGIGYVCSFATAVIPIIDLFTLPKGLMPGTKFGVDYPNVLSSMFEREWIVDESTAREVGKRRVGAKRIRGDTKRTRKKAEAIWPYAKVEIKGDNFIIDGVNERNEIVADEKGMVNFSLRHEDGDLSIRAAGIKYILDMRKNYTKAGINKFGEKFGYDKKIEKLVARGLSGKEGNFMVAWDFDIYSPKDVKPEMNRKIRRGLEYHLSEKFPISTVDFSAREKVSKSKMLIYIESKMKNGVSVSIVDAAQNKFLSQYIKSADIMKKCSVDSSDYVKTLPSEFKVNRNARFKVNLGSEYDFLVTRRGFIAAEKEGLKVDSDDIKKTFYMSRERNKHNVITGNRETDDISDAKTEKSGRVKKSSSDVEDLNSF